MNNMNYTPEQYFMSLADNDEAKYKEILLFAKQFITNTLPKFTYIYGFESNGKSLLLRLLKQLTPDNEILVFHDENVDEQAIALYSKANKNIVLVSNLAPNTTLLPPGVTKIIHMNTIFSNNGNSKYVANPNLSEELDNNKQLYYDFIMSFDNQ